MTTVESPCIRNCCLDDNDICVGCFRSLGEIAHWSQVDDDGKMNILVDADVRRIAYLTSRPNPVK